MTDADASTPERLLQRLEALAQSLAARPDALGLLALGSVGRERARLDAQSDLDFFVLVAPGAKARYIDALDWLAVAHPLAWHFRNTADGHKALMADGVFCEFAVFEPAELAGIPYAPGRWVWRRDALDAALDTPRVPLPSATAPDPAWLVGEALSNLIVGLQRLQRGEVLAAMRLIQVCAVDRLVELAERGGSAVGSGGRDPFALERRVEQRLPQLKPVLELAAQGYGRSAASALAILAYLQQQAPVPDAVAARIRALAAGRVAVARSGTRPST
jgi:hypothetical protein